MAISATTDTIVVNVELSVVTPAGDVVAMGLLYLISLPR